MIDKKENRLLGNNEKVFWVLDRKTSTQFAVVAEIDGNTSENRWRKALDSVQQRHPNLYFQIAGNEYSTAHFEHVDDCKIPLKVIYADNGDDWNGVVEEELSTPFDITIAPLVRAILIQQSGKTVFIFISNHSLGDGMSVALFIRDTLKVLSGEKIDNLASLPPLDKIAGVTVDEILKSDTSTISQTKNSLVPRAKINVSRIKLSSTLTEKLIKRSKKEKTTVHGTLTAAIVIAMKELNGTLDEKPIRILHPLSARKTLNIGENFGMLINIITTPYNPCKEESFWNLARTVRQGIATTQTTQWILTDITTTQGLFNSGLDLETVEQALHHGTEHEVMITNLGQLSFGTDFGPLNLTSLWGPMVLTPHKEALTIGVATFNGALTLTITGLKPANALLDLTERIIEAVCFSEEDLKIGREDLHLSIHAALAIATT